MGYMKEKNQKAVFVLKIKFMNTKGYGFWDLEDLAGTAAEPINIPKKK